MNPTLFGVDPMLSILGIFGGDDGFKPHLNDQGQWVFQDPNKGNPVPVTDVPGARFTPSGAYKKQAAQVQAVTDLLPYLQKAMAGQILPQAQATLAAQQATSPGLSQLMVDLYKRFGPQLNEIGNQISRQNAVSQVGTDAAALEAAKGGLIPSALEAAKLYDPEYFATRAAASDKLKELLSSINLTSGLSPVEQREISQGLAQEGQARGTAGVPSNLETVSNAMKYGQAGFNRLQTNRSALAQALNTATAAMPAFKSGTDVFQVATGKSSQPNTGNAIFPGANNVNSAMQNSAGLATNMMGNMNSTQIAQMQIDAQKKDWADYLNQVTSSISDVAGAATKFAGI